MGDDNEDYMSIAKKPSTDIVRQQRSLLRSVVAYEPTPIQRPEIDDNFGEMSAIDSTLEAFRYSAFLLEYTLSPNGWVRAWLFLWGRLFLLLAVPTVAAAVVMRLAVPLAANAAGVALQMEIAARAAVAALGWLVLGIALVAAVIAAVGWFARARRTRRYR